MFSLLCPPSLKKLEVGLLRLTHPLHVRHAGFLCEGGQSTELVLFQNSFCDSTCVCLNKRSKQSNHGAEPKRNETKEGAETGSRKREEALEAMHKAYHTITMEEVPQWPCRCCRSLAAVFDSRNARKQNNKDNTRQGTRTLKWFVPEGCAGGYP